MTNQNNVILAIDQGTTSSRAMLFSKEGSVLGLAQKDLKIHTPQSGWVEQDAEDIIRDVIFCLRDLKKNHPDDVSKISAIGITNQRETTVLWNKKTGKPVYNAIVWQDRRTADICRKLKEEGYEESIRAKTGLLLDPYFSATKIKWILDHVEGVRAAADNGDILFGTIDSFLLWHLTGRKVHATDATNASRTMLYNVVEGAWDQDLLDIFGIPKNILPRVLDNIEDFGTLDSDVMGMDLPICAMAGDQQAALFGQACFEPGLVKSTYGTGCFALMNIGVSFKVSENRLLTTVAFRMAGNITYALEGSIFVAGAAVQWLRDDMGFFKKSSQTFDMAMSVSDTDGVYFIPAFNGLGAPFWRPDVRGVLYGLSRGTKREHIVRAALEAQAYQTRDLMDAFAADSGCDPTVIRVDGGLVENEFVCQFLADQLRRTIEVPSVNEATALGVAYMAGLGCGLYADMAEIEKAWVCKRRYVPSLSELVANTQYQGWRDVLRRLL